MFSSRSGAARLALIVVAALIALKVVVAIITDSVSILAQAADSFLDLFAVGITFFAISIAGRPADTEHPFGHGKAEDLAAILQAILIFAAAVLIIYSAIRKILLGTPVEMTDAGIGVMGISTLASILLSRHLMKVARATDSIALESNAHNIRTDVYSALAVMAGLLVIRFTGLQIIDPVLGIVVTLLILRLGFVLSRKSLGLLMDRRLPEDEEQLIRAVILEHTGEQVASFHGLRTRKAGSQRQVDLHLVMPREISLEEAHRLCDHLEKDIEQKLKNVIVTIHVEPCNPGEEGHSCSVTGDEQK